jgi:SAM-dependent methyltransferase
MTTRDNAEEASIWDGPAGDHRIRHPEQDDEEVRRHDAWLRRAVDIRSGERVLDVGCGTGQTTRYAARAAAPGEVLGIDLSGRMLARARELSAAEGLPNASFVQGDAQVYPFPPGGFDVAVSRFGVMFFADPVAAFANIRGALRPGGRLVVMVWQGRDLNEWATAIREALGGAAPAGTADAFSLGDREVAAAVLEAAGFTGVAFTDVHEAVYFGGDADAAYGFARGLWSTGQRLAELDADGVRRAEAALRATMEAHETGDGVWFDSRAWIIEAVGPSD